MIKFGQRKNLFYPILLIISIFIRRVIELFFLPLIISDTGIFTLPLLIFLSQFFGGIILKYFVSVKNKKKNIAKVKGINYIQAQNELKVLDSNGKILILFIFSSYFNLAGVLIRKIGITSNDIYSKILEINVRCFHILVAATVCYFTIKIKMEKHNIVTLIIIFICLVVTIIGEFCFVSKQTLVLKSVIYNASSGFHRAFMDIIDKYLIEFAYITPFIILMFEGFFSFVLTCLLLLFRKNYGFEYEFEKLSNNSNSILLIFILILYFISSGTKNIYRTLTVKYFSPMTRALCESFLDPIVFIYCFLKNKDNYFYLNKNFIYFFIHIICITIISICSAVYNEFLIVYFCNLEYNTHLEISFRAGIKKFNDSFSDETDDTQ